MFQAQQVVELKGKEASLIVKKKHLEQRIVELDVRPPHDAVFQLRYAMCSKRSG